MDADTLVELVRFYCEDHGLKCFPNNTHGPDWVCYFYERHKDILSFRKAEPLSKQRATGLSTENVNAFFSMFDKVIKEHNITSPMQIFNVDESNLPQK